MLQLSTGDPSTLGSYKKLAETLFGQESKAVAFLERKIEEYSGDLEIIITEAQMTYLLGCIHRGAKP